MVVSILLASFYAAYIAKIRSYLGEDWCRYADGFLFILATIIISYLAQMVVSAVFRWYAANLATKTRSPVDNEFIPLFRRVAGIVIWVIALIVVLSRLGVNISALIAALGVSSLAIALAAQDTIANIISGFLIMVDRPFRVGDDIKLPTGERVKVLAIGIRRSRFLSDDGAIIIAPNVDLSKSKIVNYTYGQKGSGERGY